MSLTYMYLREPLRLILCALCVSFLPALAPAQDFSSNLHQSTTAPNPKFDEANAALDARDYEKALKLLSPLAAENPKDARILYDLGSAQDALDQSAAEQSYRAAIADDPAFLDPHVALGLMLARSGRMDDARTEFLAATKLSGDPPIKARAYRALARIDEKSRPADARDELLEALKLTPETPEDALLGAELAEAANNGAAAAEAAYRRILAAVPDDPGATASLAHLLVKQLRADEAEDLLSKALKAHPDDPALTVQLATLYAGQNKTALAVPLVQHIYEINPRDPNVGRLLSNLYLESKDYASAEPLLQKLSQQNPRDTSLVDDRARALIHLKRFADAQEILSRIVAQPTLFPTPADLGNAAGDLAFAASSNNDPETTLQALQVRGTVLPTSAPVLFLTAISHDKLHHVKLAIEAYKQFLDASKGSNPDEEFEARHRIIALAPMK
jgi:tetratricopeptide (TPR) repeat protein